MAGETFGPVPEVNLGHYMIGRMKKYGSAIALMEAKTGRSYSYANVIDKIERLAAGLRDLGMSPGDVLCMMTYNHIDIPIFTLAVNLIGGIYQPLSPANTNDDLQRQFQECKTKFLVTTSDQAQRIQQMVQLLKLKSFSFSKPNLLRYIIVLEKSDKFISYDSLIGTSRVTQPQSLNPRTTAAILLTSSGTTGLPKFVQLSHFSLVANLMQAIHTSGWRCTIGFLANYHHYGMFGVLLCNLCYGLKIVVMEKYDTVEYLRLIEWHRADYLQLVPPIAIQLIKSAQSSHVNLSTVKSIYSAAAPLGKEVETQLAALFKLKSISQTFGLTETGIATVSTESVARLGSAGKAAIGTHVKVVDVETRKELPANQVGEILCKGPQMTMGYLNNPEATKALYDNDMYLQTDLYMQIDRVQPITDTNPGKASITIHSTCKTPKEVVRNINDKREQHIVIALSLKGDVGYIDEDGFVFVSDRIKELIKYKGYQVPPAYLEDVLMKHSAIADAAVIGKPDPEAGEIPKAFIVKRQGSQISEQDIVTYIKDNVAPHMRLRGGVEFIDQIPKSPSGKILRRLLRVRSTVSKL